MSTTQYHYRVDLNCIFAIIIDMTTEMAPPEIDDEIQEVIDDIQATKMENDIPADTELTVEEIQALQ